MWPIMMQWHEMWELVFHGGVTKGVSLYLGKQPPCLEGGRAGVGRQCPAWSRWVLTYGFIQKRMH